MHFIWVFTMRLCIEFSFLWACSIWARGCSNCPKESLVFLWQAAIESWTETPPSCYSKPHRDCGAGGAADHWAPELQKAPLRPTEEAMHLLNSLFTLIPPSRRGTTQNHTPAHGALAIMPFCQITTGEAKQSAGKRKGSFTTFCLDLSVSPFAQNIIYMNIYFQ